MFIRNIRQTLVTKLITNIVNKCKYFDVTTICNRVSKFDILPKKIFITIKMVDWKN